MEDIHRLFQLLTHSSHCWWQDILLPWRWVLLKRSRGEHCHVVRWLIHLRAVSRPARFGSNSVDFQAHRCARGWPPLRHLMVGPWPGRRGVGRKRQGRVLHLWSWHRDKVPEQAWFGPRVQSTSGRHKSALREVYILYKQIFSWGVTTKIFATIRGNLVCCDSKQ